MKQFKALIIKDFNIYKKNFFTVTIVFLAMYLLGLATTLIGYYHNSGHIHIFFNQLSLHSDDISNFDLSKASYIFNASLAAFISFFFLIFTINISGNALNSDYEYKCALFHRNLPINIWKISGSRFIVTIFGSFLTLLVLLLFTSLLSNIIFASFVKISIVYSLLGILKVVLPYLINSLLLASIGFFFSSIFKRKAVGKGILILALIHFSIVYLNFLFGLHIPYFLLELGKTISFHVDSHTFSQITNQTFGKIFSNIFTSLFSFQTLLKIVYAGILFVISTLIIKYKEITE
jgi:hypothetical protein